MIHTGVDGLFDREHAICIIGAGPVGITLALELARLGQQVTLLESGLDAADHKAQQLSDAERVEDSRHADMAVAVYRALGGTSNLWGAGCVPLDPIDFEPREFVPNSGWPISYQEFAKHIPDACRYASCGGPTFAAPLDLGRSDRSFHADSLIRYAEPASFARAYKATLASSPLINVRLDATVTALRLAEDGRVDGVLVRSRTGSMGILRLKYLVVACGGVETARLLLTTRCEAPRRFGGEEGPLGRYYMGHLSGQIATLTLRHPALDESFDFRTGHSGRYLRNRLMPSEDLQRRERITNIAFWPIMPPLIDAAHQSSILSMAYLALAFPPVGRLLVSEHLRQINAGGPVKVKPHLKNIISDLPAIGRFLPRFLHGRFLAPVRLPGLHIRNTGRRYALHYHAEHLPNPNSRVTLTRERDALDMPRARIDLRFSASDAEPVWRAHRRLAEWLAHSELGELTFSGESCRDQILQQAADGVHQIGTARMGYSCKTGVVDRNCRAFGSPNLFVAGSAVFPTSGQANSTFPALVLAVRLARHMAIEARLPIQAVAQTRMEANLHRVDC